MPSHEQITPQAAFQSRHSRVSRLVASATAAFVAAAPAVVTATEEGRVLERPENFTSVFLYTALAAGSVLLVASLGRLYQLQRGIRWRFQDPDAPHDEHH